MKEKTKKPIQFNFFLLMTLLWIGFIFCRSAQPAASSSEESGTLLLFFQKLIPWLDDYLIRKAAHFTEFFILGVLAGNMAHAAGFRFPWLALPIGAAVAVTDELIQLTQEGRSCEVRDMCVDFSGVVLATALLWLIVWLRDKKHKTA